MAPKSGSDPSSHEQALIDAARQQMADLGSSMTPEEGLPQADAFPNYQLIREIHRGGQGVVYLAIQKTTKRKVAIKVMREGPFAGGAERARFEREVQILAQLKHPNIVDIHDSGVASGAFFYVMDYISGTPLDSWIGEPRPIREVLALFLKVCDAVAAAHLKGVIHRDLKPSNVRVDAGGEPHVVDFGLAKTISGDVAESSHAHVMMTMTGQFVGSLPWASPEQAEGLPDKIDVRTDVYSLGVVLYQLLTGRFPYQVAGNMRDVLDRILRAEPTRPSTIRRQIDDELETIVLKCLSKDRERRYQSAGELARDLRHYLAGEPIEAKRDSGWYLLKKAMGRYRPYAAVAAGFVLALAIFGVVLAVQNQRLVRANGSLIKAKEEISLANQDLQRVNTALTEAREEADATLSGWYEILRLVTPRASGGQEISLRELMYQAESHLDELFKGKPAVQAHIMTMIAGLHEALGNTDHALFLTKEVKRLRAPAGAAADESFNDMLTEAGSLRGRRAPGDLVEAERLDRTALEIADRHPDLIPPIQRAKAQINLARLLDGSLSLKAETPERLAEAERLLRGAIMTVESEPDSPDLHQVLVGANTALGTMLVRAGNYAEAEKIYTQWLDYARTNETRDAAMPHIVRGYLASAQFKQGRAEEAEANFIAAIDGLSQVYQTVPWHRDLLEIRANYARFLASPVANRAAEAADLWKDILTKARRGKGTISPDGAQLADWRYDSAQPLMALGRYEDARNVLADALDSTTDVSDPSFVQRRGLIAARLVEVCEKLGQPESAAQYRRLVPASDKGKPAEGAAKAAEPAPK